MSRRRDHSYRPHKEKLPLPLKVSLGLMMGSFAVVVASYGVRGAVEARASAAHAAAEEATTLDDTAKATEQTEREEHLHDIADTLDDITAGAGIAMIDSFCVTWGLAGTTSRH